MVRLLGILNMGILHQVPRSDDAVRFGDVYGDSRRRDRLAK